MKGLARKIGWRIYHFVHTNGVAADFVYWSAYYVQNFFRARQYNRFSKHHITP